MRRLRPGLVSTPRSLRGLTRLLAVGIVTVPSAFIDILGARRRIHPHRLHTANTAMR